MSGTQPQIELTPEIILRAYSIGIFPMAETRDDPELFWIDPEDRGIIPLDGLHIPRRLKRTIRKNVFDVRCNTACREVMKACAAPGPAPGRDNTWINDQIMDLYGTLHDKGFVHSVECWHENDLVGGLYGVSLGGAFFGESMFSRERDASKVALVHLVARLRHAGFILLDTQFVTEHLESLGAIEIPREEYHHRLDEALQIPATFYSGPSEGAEDALAALLQSSTQTS